MYDKKRWSHCCLISSIAGQANDFFFPTSFCFLYLHNNTIRLRTRVHSPAGKLRSPGDDWSGDSFSCIDIETTLYKPTNVTPACSQWIWICSIAKMSFLIQTIGDTKGGINLLTTEVYPGSGSDKSLAWYRLCGGCTQADPDDSMVFLEIGEDLAALCVFQAEASKRREILIICLALTIGRGMTFAKWKVQLAQLGGHRSI